VPDGSATGASGALSGAAGPLWEALAKVRDPEIPISIVDMGLVRGVERDGGRVRVALTFTSTACPCMNLIVEDVREALLAVPGVEAVEVEYSWGPAWSAGDLTPAGRSRLREWGIVG
jgi:phenylacetate-CoA oxygenase PaaJ subunit